MLKWALRRNCELIQTADLLYRKSSSFVFLNAGLPKVKKEALHLLGSLLFSLFLWSLGCKSKIRWESANTLCHLDY